MMAVKTFIFILIITIRSTTANRLPCFAAPSGCVVIQPDSGTVSYRFHVPFPSNLTFGTAEGERIAGAGVGTWHRYCHATDTASPHDLSLTFISDGMTHGSSYGTVTAMHCPIA